MSDGYLSLGTTEKRRRVPLDERKQIARINNLQEEAEYIRAQRKFYPIVVFSGVTLALIGLVKLVL